MLNNFYYLAGFYFVSPFMTCLVYIIFIGFIFWLFLFPRYHKAKKAEASAQLFTKATVLSKTMKTENGEYGSDFIPYVAFKFTDGAIKEFECDASLYDNIKEGQHGLLTYKEKGNFRIFIGFRPED